jgi:quinol monooxygenase YgiN
LIEIATNRPEEVEALVAEWREQTTGRRTAQRGTFTQDRERPNTYLQIVEFPSYEDAMANSDLPETAAFAQRLGELCDGPMVFRNLDVRSVEEL